MPEWLEIGKIIAAQGLQGEVRVYPNSDFPERFEQPGQRWILHPENPEPQSIELLSGRYLAGKGLYIVELAGVENRDQAEALRGCLLLVPESDRPPLKEDEYHVLDLIGLEVFNQLTQELVGTVISIVPAGNDLLEVQLHQQDEEDKGTRGQGDKGTRGQGDKGTRGQGDKGINPNPKSKIQNPKSLKTVLIPFVKAIAPVIDLKAKRIEITPPPGLLELNN